MYSYKSLEKILKERGIRKSDLSKNLGLSSRTVAKIGKGEKLSGRTVKKIADYLEISPDIIMKEVPDSIILWILKEEKDMNLSGDRKSTRLNSSHPTTSRMPSSA